MANSFIRVLFVRRQKQGGMAAYASALAEGLDAFNIEAVIDDAEEWIPSKTGWMTDRQVSRSLKRAAQGFDLIHAFGYRTAWACSQAFYVRQPWVYTAYDMPKTTHPQLVDRLNAARRGLCSTRAVRDALSAAETLHLQVATPCTPPLPSRAQLEDRPRLGLDKGDFVIFAAGRWAPERGLESLLRAFPDVLPQHPEARLVISAPGSLPDEARELVSAAPDRIEIIKPQPSLAPWMASADVVVIPSTRAGFSMTAAEAMTVGTPCLIRRVDGLSEMAADGESAFYYEEDDDLAGKLILLAEAPMTLEAVGRSAAVRAMQRFSQEQQAEDMARLFRDLLDR